MNRHSLTWADHAKFRWASRRVARRDLIDGIKTVAVLIGILLAYGIVGRMDYEDALITEAQIKAADARSHQERLLACLNGGSTGLYTTDEKGNRHFIVCDKAYTISDENTGKRS